jgi:formyltetrahydrofolate deformylase
VNYRVLIDCSDDTGLVYKISKVLTENNLNIEKNSEFVDEESKKFFMRTVVCGDINIDKVKSELSDTLPKDASVKIVKAQKKKVIIMCTKENHAIGDLLLRYDCGELEADIECVVSNYDILRPLVEKFGIKYHSVNADGLSREEHEQKVLDVLAEYSVDYILLAKYMRILTPNFVSKYENKIVNIHHSFLPAFIGANPYKQAYERGVKIIGATAHFVTNDLDEGPIIEQNVVSVDHNFGWKDMQSAGRDVEKSVFSKAINLVLADRVFINGNKTIIF